MQTWWRVVCVLGLTACVRTPFSEDPGTPTLAVSSRLPTSTASPLQAPSPTASETQPPPAATPIMAATPGASPTAVFQLCTPLEGHPLTELVEILSNPFLAPRPGKDDGHHGADFSYYRRGERDTIQGVPVQSILDGQVAAVVDNRPPYGYMVIVETPGRVLPGELAATLGVLPGESLFHLYAHLDGPPIVRLGEPVRCGQTLGAVGNSGWSGNPHLHLENRVGSARATFSEMAFYDTRATVEEMDNYRRWRMSGEFRAFDPLLLLGGL